MYLRQLIVVAEGSVKLGTKVCGVRVLDGTYNLQVGDGPTVQEKKSSAGTMRSILAGDTVMIPDFSFTHRKDGRRALLEIVGFWRPEYLRRKLEKLRQAQRRDLIVAVSRDLNVSEEDFAEVPGGVFFFKNRIQPREVIDQLEKIEFVLE